MNNFYRNKRVLITGANGFKGTWLSIWLNMLGAKVTGIGLSKDDTNFNIKVNLNNYIKFYNLDVRKKKKLFQLVNSLSPEIVFHLAAQPIVFEGYKNPDSTFETNIIGTLNILEACNKNKKVKSLICVTSDKSYKNIYTNTPYKENDVLMGDDPYSASKSAADIVINSYQLTLKRNNIGIVSARAGNVIGGGDFSKNRIIPDLVRSLVKKKKIILRNPKATRPWQHVLDPLHGYLILGYLAYKKPKKFSQAFNFGPEYKQIINVKSICYKFLKYWGEHKKIITIKKNKIKEHGKLVLNINKSKKLINWSPIFSINESIFKTFEWYNKVFINKQNMEVVTKQQIINFSKNTFFKIYEKN
jgi:CDP-glucose 4,6-dehydratase